MKPCESILAKLFPWFKWLWAVILGGLFLELVGNLLFSELREEVANFLSNHWGKLLFALAALAVLALWSEWKWRKCQQEKQQRILEQEFALYKPATRLLPGDLGFQVLKPGECPDLNYRPHYHTYIPRKLMISNENLANVDQKLITEEDLRTYLQDGKSFALLGPPLTGKSRTLYEVVKRLKKYVVVRPFKDRTIPSDAAFSLLKDQQVVLLLEDLNEYTYANLDLREFRQKFDKYVQSCVVVATCRDGPELGMVSKALERSLSRFYEENLLGLRFIPQTLGEKEQLAQSIGRVLDSRESNFFPTPGSITMADSLKAMQSRFQQLCPEQKDTLRALQLLALTRLPPTHHRLQAVLEGIFQRTPHLGDCLDKLTDHAFLCRPARQDPIQPEPAYLGQAVSYLEGKSPKDDIPGLIDVLVKQRDNEGLFRLGEVLYHSVTSGYALSLGYKHALKCYEQVLNLKQDSPDAWYKKAEILRIQGFDQEAIDAFDKALSFRRDFEEAQYLKEIALRRLDIRQRREAFLSDSCDNWYAWYTKGRELASIGCYLPAVIAYDKALRLKSDFPDALFYKGKALVNAACIQEGVDVFDQALHIRPNDLDALFDKAMALLFLNRNPEAVECLCQTLRALANLPYEDMRRNRAILVQNMLRNLGHDPKVCFEESALGGIDGNRTN